MAGGWENLTERAAEDGEVDSGSRREWSSGAPPLLMSGESACPIIEAMLRAQIAETRDWRGKEKLNGS